MFQGPPTRVLGISASLADKQNGNVTVALFSFSLLDDCFRIDFLSDAERRNVPKKWHSVALLTGRWMEPLLRTNVYIGKHTHTHKYITYKHIYINT